MVPAEGSGSPGPGQSPGPSAEQRPNGTHSPEPSLRWGQWAHCRGHGYGPTAERSAHGMLGHVAASLGASVALDHLLPRDDPYGETKKETEKQRN